MEISSPHSHRQEHHNDCLLLADEQKMVDIEEPHHNDVLCGRGVTTNRHPGNESFRSLVGLNKEVYVSSTKRQKMAISRSIVEAVRSLDPPGRFLEKDPVTGLWSEIGHKKAVEKTSQALRDGAASLRKQLSADLVDPEFFNDVFDAERDIKQKDPSKDEGEDTKKNAKAEKKSPETTKAIKKVKGTPTKKVHKRTNSSPGKFAAVSRQQRRSRALDPHPSPGSRLSNRYPQVPPSPRSPVPRHAMSQPSTPMSWSSRTMHYDRDHIDAQGPETPHSPFNPSVYDSSSASPHYTPHQPYEPQSPVVHHLPPGGRQPFQHPHSWHSSNRYYAHHYSEQPHQDPRNTMSGHHNAWRHTHGGHPRGPRAHTPPPAPSLGLPRGPLPPGRHHFSPAGYSGSRQPDWGSKVDTNSASPGYYHDQAFAHQSPRWNHHYHFDSYATPPPDTQSTSCSSSNRSTSSSLSVPTLGGESTFSSKSRPSPRVLLTPRSRSSFGEVRSRGPTLTPREFTPPPSLPRFRHIRDRSLSDGNFESSRTSPAGEEKKTEYEETPDRTISKSAYSAMPKASTVSKGMTLGGETHVSRTRVDHDADVVMSERSTSLNESKGPRASPVSARIETVAAGTDAPDQVEDIAMSPIPFDREDPSTLMEVPEDILTLPISPCGPNDDPLASRR